MLRVSTEAKEKLKEVSREFIDVAPRIFRSTSTPCQLRLVIDKESEGDQVVKDEKGRKILLIQSDLASELDCRVIDYQQTPQGSGFTKSQPAPGA